MSELRVSLEDGESVLSLRQVEQRYIELMLRFTEGNKSHAAQLLGIDRRTLYRKLGKKGEPDG